MDGPFKNYNVRYENGDVIIRSLLPPSPMEDPKQGTIVDDLIGGMFVC